MRINHNISALNTYRQLSINTNNTSKSLEKLSSGLRINRAGDDAAGLAISEKMRGQIRGLDMAIKNAQDGISLIQTAEGALNEVHSILQRMRELAVQAANDTNATEDRQALQDEVSRLIEEINRIANDTEFNTKKLLDGTFGASGAGGASGVGGASGASGAGGASGASGAGGASGGATTRTGLIFHIGANAGQNITLHIESMKAADLASGLDSIDITTQSGADRAITTIQNAINTVSQTRSELGAVQNRLEHTINNLGTASENLSAAESRIRDVDMAKEMMEFTKLNILNQAATAMLAQANTQPQIVLQLLQ